MGWRLLFVIVWLLFLEQCKCAVEVPWLGRLKSGAKKISDTERTHEEVNSISINIH